MDQRERIFPKTTLGQYRLSVDVAEEVITAVGNKKKMYQLLNTFYLFTYTTYVMYYSIQLVIRFVISQFLTSFMQVFCSVILNYKFTINHTENMHNKCNVLV